MLWSIVNEADIFFDENSVQAVNTVRSSNPYKYLRSGYFIDNASMFGGKNIVNYNCNISGNSSGADIYSSHI